MPESSFGDRTIVEQGSATFTKAGELAIGV